MFRLSVDTSDIIDLTQRRIPRSLESAYYLSSVRLRSEIKQIVIEVFTRAMGRLDDFAWPLQYTEQVLDSVQWLPIIVTPSANGLDVFIDWDDLGTQDELKTAYHYRARLAGGGEVSFPYRGQPLAPPDDPKKRHAWWWEHVLMDPPKMDETIQARVSQWARYRAPEWLFLQYGVDYSPSFPPFPILELIETDVNAAVLETTTRFADQPITNADYLGAGISYEPAGRESGIR